MIRVFYDFHIHSCLSPCGDDEMTPNNIVNMAALQGLQAIALSDHNSTGNCAATMEAGERCGVLVLPAMELNTSEEAHILCLFETWEDAQQMNQVVKESLLPIHNKKEAFGNQYYMDGQDNILGEEDILLITGSGIGVYDVQALCRSFNGVAIPAHIDRSSYSVISTLGFFTEEMDFRTMEVTKDCDLVQLIGEHSELKDCSFIRNSDAHYLEQIPEATCYLKLPELSAKAILDYFRALQNPQE